MSYALLPEGLMSKRAASAVVCIERDRSCCAMPKEFHTVLGSAMFWGAAEARMFDVPTVLSRVLVLYQQVVPTVQVPSIVDDERMSFWLLESLPLSCERQHELFCMSTLHRLKEVRFHSPLHLLDVLLYDFVHTPFVCVLYASKVGRAMVHAQNPSQLC